MIEFLKRKESRKENETGSKFEASGEMGFEVCAMGSGGGGSDCSVAGLVRVTGVWAL